MWLNWETLEGKMFLIGFNNFSLRPGSAIWLNVETLLRTQMFDVKVVDHDPPSTNVERIVSQ